jgi:hypothetical protein
MKTLPKTKRPKKPPLLHRDVQYHVAMFLQEYPPKKFNREFRNVFIDFLRERQHVSHRIDNKMVVEGIWDLIRVLDHAADCWEYRDIDEIIDQYHGR